MRTNLMIIDHCYNGGIGSSLIYGSYYDKVLSF